MLEARGLNKGRISKGLFLLREMRKRLGCEFGQAGTEDSTPRE